VAAAEWHELVAMLGMTVRKVRKLLGWSQEELAKQAIVSQGTISRLERGMCDSVPFHSVVVVFRTLAAGAAARQLPLSPTATQLLAFPASLNGDVTAIAAPDADVDAAETDVEMPDAVLAAANAELAVADAEFDDVAYLARILHRMAPQRRAAFLTIIRAAAAALEDDDA
jgi:transcriptional regulator with XRE-family HTH domain